MTGRIGGRRRGGLAFSLRGVAALLLTMLMVAALAGCGGDSPDDGRERDSSRPEATESREEAAEDRAARRETRQASPGATAEPEATEAAGGAMPRLRGVEVVEETEGEFASVSAGGGHTCGVRRDGAVACWGDDGEGQATPPGGEFASVSAGGGHTCGVTRDGAVACWGRDGKGQATPPAGEFASVSAGWDHTCGVMRDGAVACWGSQARGLTAADFE